MATSLSRASDGPPGYVDKIVWPNYVDAHKWLFENDDVEGKLKEDVLAAKGIRAQLGKGWMSPLSPH